MIKDIKIQPKFTSRGVLGWYSVCFVIPNCDLCLCCVHGLSGGLWGRWGWGDWGHLIMSHMRVEHDTHVTRYNLSTVHACCNAYTLFFTRTWTFGRSLYLRTSYDVLNFENTQNNNKSNIAALKFINFVTTFKFHKMVNL